MILNSNKRSVVLDLKTDAGRQALLDLVDTADVLIENFAPGTMERLRLAPDLLIERDPRLIVASRRRIWARRALRPHVGHGYHRASDVRQCVSQQGG